MTDDGMITKKVETLGGQNGDGAARDMAVLELTADASRLRDVQAFVKAQLRAARCSERTEMTIEIIVEEIFVNITSYAYADSTGKVTVAAGLTDDESALVMMFVDEGTPYNPLAKADPDVTAEAADRAIGGMGILMVKTMADGMTYRYQNGQNVLTIIKKLED